MLAHPTYCVVKGVGKCRILYYEGKGRFRVLTNRDSQRTVHRSKMQFLPDAPPTITKYTQGELFHG